MRCTVAHLMRQMGLRRIVRENSVRTTIGGKGGAGFSYVAFVIDAYARGIVGWRVARSMEGDFHARCSGAGAACSAADARHRPCPPTAIAAPGTSHPLIGLFKPEVIHRLGLRRS